MRSASAFQNAAIAFDPSHDRSWHVLMHALASWLEQEHGPLVAGIQQPKLFCILIYRPCFSHGLGT